MNDTSEEDIANFIRSSEQTEGREKSETDGTEENKSSQISVPLSKHRLLYLEHLIDDVYCFLNYENRQRNYEVLC